MCCSVDRNLHAASAIDHWYAVIMQREQQLALASCSGQQYYTRGRTRPSKGKHVVAVPGGAPAVVSQVLKKPTSHTKTYVDSTPADGAAPLPPTILSHIRGLQYVFLRHIANVLIRFYMNCMAIFFYGQLYGKLFLSSLRLINRRCDGLPGNGFPLIAI
jgi:hypothetical protein